tara:strand:- start:1391 stop:2062 length:672 start_codon:yes stop_codon:yes gene_type:complete
MDKVVYDLDFNEKIDLEGVFSISLVSTPAIKSNFITLSEQTGKQQLSAIDDDKRLLVGAALIPNQAILRKDGSYIRFSEEVVRKSMEAFFQRDYQKNSNIEHTEDNLSGMCVVESWIVDDPKVDKSVNLGLEGIVKGTWMVVMKVDNEEVYQLAKEGKVKGFSIEGMFPERTEVKLSQDKELADKIADLDMEDLDALSDICEAAIGMADSKEEALEFIKRILM